MERRTHQNILHSTLAVEIESSTDPLSFLTMKTVLFTLLSFIIAASSVVATPIYGENNEVAKRDANFEITRREAENSARDSTVDDFFGNYARWEKRDSTVDDFFGNYARWEERSE
ncbi:unnamed protein product [Somion occarium]|uniref:RxLR effector protein n=1 Tax=Somion occarium TaxID=3059160 RepID=A0ABP1DWC4_9APHY